MNHPGVPLSVPAAEPPSKLWTRDFSGVCIVNFLQFLLRYAVMVALPLYVVDVLKGHQGRVGLVLAFFQAGSLLFRPFAGQLSDRVPKKKLLIVSLSLHALVCALFAAVRSLPLLLFLCALHGAVFSAVSTTLGTLAANLAPADRKGEGLSTFSMFTSLAMVLGPLSTLSLIGRTSFFFLFALMTGVAILSLLLLLRLALDEPIRRRASSSRRIFFERRAFSGASLGFVLTFVYSAILGYLPVYARTLGIGQAAGYFFALYAVASVLVRPWIGGIFDKKGSSVVVCPSIIALASGFFLLSFVQGMPSFFLSGLVIGAGFGALQPSFQALSVIATPPARRGLATSTYYFFFDLGMTAGALVWSVVSSGLDLRAVYFLASCVSAALYFAYTALRNRQLLAR